MLERQNRARRGLPTVAWLVALVAMLHGCPCGSDDKSQDDAGIGEDGDGGILPPGDGGVPPLACTANASCPQGNSCIGGVCQPDPCTTAANTLMCTGDQTCQASCKVQRDACFGVTCPNGQFCNAGQCIPGCYPNPPCAALECPEGQYCDDTDAINPVCRAAVPCDAQCPEGQICHLACASPAPPNPCDNLMCAEDTRCVVNSSADPPTASCVANPCFGVTCPNPATSYCNPTSGDCVDTCNCPNCPGGQRCVMGVCQCDSNCSAVGCGGSNTCGQACTNCPAGQVCKPDGDGMAEASDCCAPACASAGGTGQACASKTPTNACGGNNCAQCQAGLSCVGNLCCNNSCTGKLCGEKNACGNNCTGCPSGQTCDPDGDNVAEPSDCCVRQCAAPAAAGQTCASNVPTNGCGGNNCPQCQSGLKCGPGNKCCDDSCAGKACGQVNACGKVCSGACPTPGDICRQNGSNYSCCDPVCAAPAINGSCNNGCGQNNCPCPAGSSCNNGICKLNNCPGGCAYGLCCNGNNCEPCCPAGRAYCAGQCCNAGQTCNQGTTPPQCQGSVLG